MYKTVFEIQNDASHRVANHHHEARVARQLKLANPIRLKLAAFLKVLVKRLEQTQTNQPHEAIF